MNRARLIELCSAGPVITEQDWHRLQKFQPRFSLMFLSVAFALKALGEKK